MSYQWREPQAKTSATVTKRPGDNSTAAYRKRYAKRRHIRHEVWWMNNAAVEADYVYPDYVHLA